MRAFNHNRKQQISTDAGVVAEQSIGAHIQIDAEDAPAASNTGVLALTGLGDEAQEITTSITNPAVPRALRIVGSVAGITGDVVATGKNIAGEVIEETIALNGAIPADGTKAFKEVTKITLPAETHAETLQQETATVVGTISTSGDAEVIVTAAGMDNSPKTIDVPVLEGVAQVETGTAVGNITTSGNAEVIVTAVGMTGTPKTVNAAVVEGTLQVETATAALDGAAITTSGDAEVIVTANGMDNSPKSVAVAVTAGVLQVETAEVVGTIGPAGAGNAEVIVTADGMGNSPKTVTVAVANDDSAEIVAGKIRDALGLDADVSAFFTISGAGTYVVLTAKTKAANDATMNISIDNDTCTGLTPAPTSVDTVAGVAPDDVNAVAGKIRTALGLDADVSGFFTISGESQFVVLTKKVKAANDGTLNISIADDTCDGITTAANSAQTVAGVAQDNAASVAEKIRTALGLDADVAAFFTIGGAGANIILTAKTNAANDATMNMAIDNGTCEGLTAAPTSANTVAGVAPDNAAAVAAKIRTALSTDDDVTELFTVGGTGVNIVLTAIDPATDDATLNISIDNGTCAGLTTASTSANTTGGVPIDFVSVGWNDILGLPYKLVRNTILAAYLDNTKEGTAPTVTVDPAHIELNTIDLNSALNGSQVDIYLIV